MRKPIALGLLCLALGIGPTACSRNKSVAADPQGSYSLCHDEFAKAVVQRMREAGQVPAGTEAAAEARLRQVHFDLVLESGGRFTATMGFPGATKKYAGTWQHTLGKVELLQTHEEDEEVSDRMTGTFDGKRLALEHEEMGMKLPYILEKRTPAAPR
jgi:hypothetical protein